MRVVYEQDTHRNVRDGPPQPITPHSQNLNLPPPKRYDPEDRSTDSGVSSFLVMRLVLTLLLLVAWAVAGGLLASKSKETKALAVALAFGVAPGTMRVFAYMAQCMNRDHRFEMEVKLGLTLSIVESLLVMCFVVHFAR